MAGKAPNTIDREIGERIRSRRIAACITLNALATALGISYQQVQKYEKGINRISSSRLQQIAETLGTTVTDFYASEGHQARVPPRDQALFDLMQTRDGRRLVQSYEALGETQRRALLAFLDTLK